MIQERTVEETVREMVEILKEMPQERQAYLNGYAAGMNAERRLAQTTDDTRSA